MKYTVKQHKNGQISYATAGCDFIFPHDETEEDIEILGEINLEDKQVGALSKQEIKDLVKKNKHEKLKKSKKLL